MTFPSLLKKIRSNASQFAQYMPYVAITALALLAAWLMMFGYRWYNARRDMAAQYAFARAMEQFAQAQHTKTDSWAYVESAFKFGYEQHSSSNLAPYFLAFQAQALLNQGKQQEALDLLNKTIAMIPTSSPLISLYKTKKALVMIDSQDQTQHDAGLQELISMAHDAKNRYRDEAMYYLGLYYASLGDVEHARAEWNLLVQAFPAQGQVGSVYAELAQARLEQLA
jgi:tetratricopeptide (TPR) repeat protein